jgi:putative peptidoglycan lipid II flippase
LLCALFVCAVFAQLASTPVSLARAEELPPTPLGTPVIETVQAISSEANTPVALLYVPGLSWEQLGRAGDSDTEALLAGSALGNLSAPSEWPVESLLANPAIGIYTCTETDSLRLTAREINRFISIDLPENGILVIVTAPVFSGGEVSRDFTPILVHGGGFEGYLTSDTTHRKGLIATPDLTLLVSHLNEPEGSPGYSAATARSLPTGDTTLQRIEKLQHELTTTASTLATKIIASYAFLALIFITFAFSILLFFLGRRDRIGSRGLLVPVVRILWLVVLSFPPATFLMFTVLPVQPTPNDLAIAAISWVAVISLAALLFGLFTKWVNSLIALYGLTIIVIIIGQVFGGPLNTAGYLTYDITEGARYYGMGNEQGAMFFGSWITLAGLLINRYPDARGIPAFKKWGYPLGSAVLLFIATSPWLGASFGPLVWGFLGCFVSWWLFNGRRLRWWGAALIVIAAFALALGVLYIDVSLNPASHMGRLESNIHESLISVIARIAADAWTYSFSLIYDYVPAVFVIFLAFVFVLLVVLRVLQPGSYREFWQRNTAFRAVYSVCFVLAAVTFVLEDSGVFTPAVLLIYPLACFTWLICDLHTWHIRTIEASSRPITLRELQQSTLKVLGSKKSGAIPAETLPDGDREGGESSAQTVLVPAELAADPPPSLSPEEILAAEIAAEGVGGVEDVGEIAGVTEPEAPSVARSTVTMSMATLLSRITGFVRTWAIAFALGNTAFASSFFVANNLPNMLYELIAGGVLTTAFLPVYLAQREKHGKDGAAAYASNLLSISAIVLGAVVILATIFAPQVIFTQSFLNTDADYADIPSAIFLFRFFAIQVIFYGVGAIISGLLNANRSFLWPALGPVFNNIVVIVTLFGFPFMMKLNPTGAMVWLGVGTSLGVVAMFIVQIPALIKLKIPLRFHVNLRDPALVDTLRMALPAMVYVIMSLIAVSVMNAVALKTAPTGVSTIQYAWVWYLLPYGVIAVALSTALLTEMSGASAAQDWSTFRGNVRFGLRSTLFLIIPLAAIIFTLSNQLTGLYNAVGGAFTHNDVLEVANVLAVWCLGLPFYAAYMFIYRAFSALRELKRFVAIDACGRVLLIILYGFFTTGFGLWEGLGLIGIPLADGCVNLLLCAVMLIVLRKRIGSFGLGGIIKDGFRILAASLLAILVPFFISYGDYDQSILVSLATILLCGLFALVVYYLFCRLFKVPEVTLLNSVLSKLTSRLRRNKDG